MNLQSSINRKWNNEYKGGQIHQTKPQIFKWAKQYINQTGQQNNAEHIETIKNTKQKMEQQHRA